MKLLLEEKILEKKSKKSSKFYWILETITGKTEATEESEDFDLISSDKGYLQDVKEEIIEKINAANVFSFAYEPKEGDYLSIKNNLESNSGINFLTIAPVPSGDPSSTISKSNDSGRLITFLIIFSTFSISL